MNTGAKQECPVTRLRRTGGVKAPYLWEGGVDGHTCYTKVRSAGVVEVANKAASNLGMPFGVSCCVLDTTRARGRRAKRGEGLNQSEIAEAGIKPGPSPQIILPIVRKTTASPKGDRHD